MTITPVTAEDMRAAQLLTGTTLALFVLVGFAPGLQAHARQLRLAILVIYLAGIAVLVTRALLR